jgi:glucose/mannose transport system substrate-binding protein
MSKKRFLIVLMTVFMIAAMAMPFGVGAQDGESDLTGELEIFSWWAGDEGPALEALIDEYEAQHPDVEVINATVAGGSGVNARAVLKTRMLGGDPPDSFQVHAGEELIGTWVVADRMEDLTFLFEEQGWLDEGVFPPELIDTITFDEGIWSVPVNIHRSNVMWYTPETIDSLGVTVPTTWDEFLAVCPDIQDQGVTPMVVAAPWTVNHLWENVALAVLGPEGWAGIWDGTTDPAGAEMQEVWSTFGEVLACTNVDEDASGLSWQQAIDRVVSGEAAFNIMGDWAAGYMVTTLELEPGEGFGYAAAPGTDGEFLWLSDSFGLPVGAAHPDNTLAWLELLGSVEGQDIFNPLKGSIPARLDADVTNPDLYNQYLRDAASDFSSNVLVGSLAHGTVANEQFMNEFNSVMEIYLSSRSPEAASAAMAAVCAQTGACE